ncbi:MAG: MATE family efflux transporter [Eubacteriales bacterium]|nr:MATE family efflux transporter [Eubacteriales bacterium]
MKNKEFFRDMLRLAIPISLQNLLAASMHLVDSAMIVRLGDEATAAVGMAGRWFFMFNIILFGVASGASVLMAQYWGMKDEKNIKRAYGLGMINSLGVVLVSMVFMLVAPGVMMKVFAGNQTELITLGAEYMRIACFGSIAMAVSTMLTSVLRNTEQVKLPLFASLFSVVSNTVLNYALIYGKLGFPALGVAGAAYATVISQWLQVVLLLIVCYKEKNVAAAKFSEMFSMSRAFVAKFYKIAVWVLINEIVWAVGSNLYSVVLGRQGASNYAAYTLFASIDNLAFSFFIGFGNACVVMVGKSVGAGDNERAWGDAKRFCWTTVVIAALMGIFLAVMRGPLVELMNPTNPETAEMAKRLLLIGSFMTICRLLPYTFIVGIFRSGGSPKISAFIDLLPMYLIGLPLTFLAGFVWKLPFELVFSCVYVEEASKVIIGLIVFMKKGWMRRLTEDAQPAGEVLNGAD